MKLVFCFSLLLGALARAETTELVSCENVPWQMSIGFEKMGSGYDNASISVDDGQNNFYEFVAPVHRGGLLAAVEAGLLLTNVDNNKDQALVTYSGKLATWTHRGRLIAFDCNVKKHEN